MNDPTEKELKDFEEFARSCAFFRDNPWLDASCKHPSRGDSFAYCDISDCPLHPKQP